MFKPIHFYALLASLLGLRLVSMAFVPMVDTSEPRYAEIARLMLETNDWITPWFSPDVPFWGKPPFSFWAQAVSFKLLGVNEFAGRFPSWLANLMTVLLIFKLASVQFGTRVAQVAVLIFSSCALVFVTMGAVITDPFFALATTWAMVAYALAQSHPHWGWRYGFFAALALGLLTKGPLAGVLVAAPIVAGLMFSKQSRRGFMAMPWFKGFALMLALSLPWYVLAELKTPGFLNYFLVGEHFYRFVYPGWAGDLYGSAHREPKGKIWGDYLESALPWSLVALFIFFGKTVKGAGRERILMCLRDPARFYLVSWAIFTPLFFSFSGNLLWTYVLPALPAFSILLALALDDTLQQRIQLRWAVLCATVVVPLTASAIFGSWVFQPWTLKTEKFLVAEALAQMKPQDQLAYLGPTPFSATFYSKGRAQSVALDSLAPHSGGQGLYLAVPKEALDSFHEKFGANTLQVTENYRYVLFKLAPSLK